MIQTDIQTMFIMNGILSFTMAIFVAAVAKNEEKTGLSWWAWGLLSATASYAVLGAKGYIDDELRRVIANSLHALMMAFLLESLFEYNQLPPPRLMIWTLTCAVCLTYFSLIDNQSVRIIVNGFSMMMASIIAFVIGNNIKKTSVGKGPYFLLTGISIVAIGMGNRLISALIYHDTFDTIMANNSKQAGTFILSGVTLTCISLGLVLMSKDREHQKHKTMAMQDELTTLPNRRFTFNAIDNHLAFARRNKHPLTILVIDIDHFKHINDRYGHESGDSVLKVVSQTLASKLRSHDIVGRIGGEEFVIVAPGTEIEGAKVLSERLRKTVESQKISISKNETVQVTISIGIYSGKPDTENTADLVKYADEALYTAKNSGRNQFSVYRAGSES